MRCGALDLRVPNNSTATEDRRNEGKRNCNRNDSPQLVLMISTRYGHAHLRSAHASSFRDRGKRTTEKGKRGNRGWMDGPTWPILCCRIVSSTSSRSTDRLRSSEVIARSIKIQVPVRPIPALQWTTTGAVESSTWMGHVDRAQHPIASTNHHPISTGVRSVCQTARMVVKS